MADWPQHLGRVILPEVDSTNNAALARVGQGDCWVLTHAQTAGVGRRGKVWHMPPGNFAASLLMHSDEPLGDLAQRSFVAALALRDALDAAGAEDISLKWPNDVLVRGRKIAGILLVSAPGAIVIGVGVNLAAAPDPATLEPWAMPPIALDGRIAPEAFLTLLAVAFDHHESTMRRLGFAPIRAAWLRHAARLGQIIHAKLPDRTLTGSFETIDESGALVLDTEKGRVTLPAAEVFF